MCGRLPAIDSDDPRKSSFAPVIDRNTRVLLLGSLPGEASLAAQRYYAHPRNQFWHLSGGAIGVDLPALPYQARLELLLAAGVGLWDVARSARRRGSLDSAMREVEGNALADLAALLPGLRAIGFNGGTAARIGRALLGKTSLTLIDLPSSSPAYARVTIAQKAEVWRAIRSFLDPAALQSARKGADRMKTTSMGKEQ
jgi:TDG/mug DNA glycosylase family protein